MTKQFVLALGLLATTFAEAQPIKAVQLDLARQIETVEFVKEFSRRVAAAGYNTIFFYIEDRIRTETYPWISPEESYTVTQVKEMVDEAISYGLDVIPVLSPFGHVDRFLRHHEMMKYAEIKDGTRGRFSDQPSMFCPEDPAVQAWVEKYITEVAALFPGENFHFGFDEMDDLGFCPRCRELKREVGLAGLHLRGIEWAHRLARKLGKRMWIWTDFFSFFPEDFAKLPRDVIVCVGSYCPDMDRNGIRNNFGGRERCDLAAFAHDLGLEVVTIPWYNVENIRAIRDYSAKNSVEGQLFTQWELYDEFHGWHFPRVLAVAELWGRETSVVNDTWINAGVKAAFPSADARLRGAVAAVLAEENFWFDPPVYSDCADRSYPRAKILAWRTLLDILRAAPSHPGVGEVPVHPLSEEGLLDDLATRVEMSILCAEARNMGGRLVFPDRTAAETHVVKRLVADGERRWNELVARRLAQWKAWRPGPLTQEIKSLHASYGEFARAIGAVPDQAQQTEWLLETEVLMTDVYGIPYWKVEGRFGDEWRELASGAWKPRVGDDPHLVKKHVLSLDEPPSTLRIVHHGYGAGFLNHVSMRNRSRRIVPVRVLATHGNVRDVECLTSDDYRPARFGDPDCTAAMLDPELAKQEASVELQMGNAKFVK